MTLGMWTLDDENDQRVLLPEAMKRLDDKNSQGLLPEAIYVEAG